jgi:outer membrane protein assembly factor BamB
LPTGRARCSRSGRFVFRRWQKKLNAEKAIEVYGDPVVSGSTLFITAKGALYALSAVSGDPVFAPLSGVTTPVLPVGKAIWCGRGAALVSLNQSDGSVIREFPTPSAVSGKLALSGTVIAAPLANGKIFTLDTATVR